MNEISCSGWDGANPLHVLASLGTVVLVSRHDPLATLHWKWTGHWTPVIRYHVKDWTKDDQVAVVLADDLRRLGATGTVDPMMNRRVAELKTRLKKMDIARKAALQKAKAEGKHMDAPQRRTAMDAIAATSNRDISKANAELAIAQDQLNDALGDGIAHLGPIIGVPAPLFRRKAEAACLAWLATQPIDHRDELLTSALSAQACDALLDQGQIQPTPFSFSNGSSGQCLLKDFRGCATACSDSAITGSWAGHPHLSNSITGLNWDPADQRSYALQWDSPESGRSHDPVVNACAFLGLSIMTAVPAGPRLQAVAWRRGRPDQFTWPIWEPALNLTLIRSLFATDIGATEQGQERGIVARFSSERINPSGKRNFFAPSRPA